MQQLQRDQTSVKIKLLESVVKLEDIGKQRHYANRRLEGAERALKEVDARLKHASQHAADLKRLDEKRVGQCVMRTLSKTSEERFRFCRETLGVLYEQDETHKKSRKNLQRYEAEKNHMEKLYQKLTEDVELLDRQLKKWTRMNLELQDALETIKKQLGLLFQEVIEKEAEERRRLEEETTLRPPEDSDADKYYYMD